MIIVYDDDKGYIDVTNDDISLYLPNGTLLCRITDWCVWVNGNEFEFVNDENGNPVIRRIR